MLEVIHNLGGIALGETHMSSVEHNSTLHEVLEHVSHRQVGDMTIVSVHSINRINILNDSGCHSNHVTVSNDGTLRHTRGSGGIANHTDIISLHLRVSDIGERTTLLHQLPETIKSDVVGSSLLLELLGDLSILSMSNHQ